MAGSPFARIWKPILQGRHHLLVAVEAVREFSSIFRPNPSFCKARLLASFMPRGK
jgi:hypothetical protein